MPSLRRILVASALLVVGVVAVGAAVSADEAPRSSGAGGGGSSVWSARRVPQLVGDQVAILATNKELDGALGSTSVCFIAADPAVTITDRNAGTTLTPASTEKILTGYGALRILGPDFRFETRAVAPGPAKDGVIDRLYLAGSGDPVLATSDYQAWLKGQPKHRDDVTTSIEGLADAIVKSGVRSIPGGIVVDDSRYEKVRYIPTWRDSYRLDGEVGPIGALTVNDGFANYRGRPVGAPDPAVLAGDTLAVLLQERGVTVGATTAGNAPANATNVGVVQSPPLSDIVASMIRSSDNYTAEMLTRELATRTGANPGTTSAGTKATIAQLAEGGVRVEDITMIDGSGLDRGNKVSCAAIDLALRAARADQRYAAIDRGLAVAGKTGTLVDRFGGTALVGRLRAKTGTLQGVTGLTGVIDGPRPITFTMIANDSFDLPRGFLLQQRAALALNGFGVATQQAESRVPPPR